MEARDARDAVGGQQTPVLDAQRVRAGHHEKAAHKLEGSGEKEGSNLLALFEIHSTRRVARRLESVFLFFLWVALDGLWNSM